MQVDENQILAMVMQYCRENMEKGKHAKYMHIKVPNIKWLTQFNT